MTNKFFNDFHRLRRTAERLSCLFMAIGMACWPMMAQAANTEPIRYLIKGGDAALVAAASASIFNTDMLAGPIYSSDKIWLRGTANSPQDYFKNLAHSAGLNYQKTEALHVISPQPWIQQDEAKMVHGTPIGFGLSVLQGATIKGSSRHCLLYKSSQGADISPTLLEKNGCTTIKTNPIDISTENVFMAMRRFLNRSNHCPYRSVADSNVQTCTAAEYYPLGKLIFLGYIERTDDVNFFIQTPDGIVISEKPGAPLGRDGWIISKWDSKGVWIQGDQHKSTIKTNNHAYVAFGESPVILLQEPTMDADEDSPLFLYANALSKLFGSMRGIEGFLQACEKNNAARKPIYEHSLLEWRNANTSDIHEIMKQYKYYMRYRSLQSGINLTKLEETYEKTASESISLVLTAQVSKSGWDRFCAGQVNAQKAGHYDFSNAFSVEMIQLTRCSSIGICD